jgi:hypothetical protein
VFSSIPKVFFPPLHSFQEDSPVRRVHVIIGLLTFAAAAVIATGGNGQDKKDDPKKGDPPPIANPKLPQGWGKLGIQGEQKKKILAVVASYQGKIKVLREQIDELTKEEYKEAYKLLNDEQRDTLKKLADKGGGIDPGKDDKKKVDDKKGDDKKDPPK